MADQMTRDRAAYDALLHASDLLEQSNVRVLSQVWDRRQATIVIDKPPQFVRGVVKTRMRCGQQIVSTCAAPYHGVQLEWVLRVPISQEVGHA